ncbi:hypothetical protein [Bianquea renquensis]|uniref:Uncharacterized protein n=1 Tax=Bianquea renquensis TaxID=2763661 RepID=A0A926DV52_9FIRM|nr:hypothetical protein [Bianquea renquensis]MBC8544407.1 hypothetical protein [Bianquea renquensis]
MHAGLARNSRDQRAHAAKFPAITVKTIIPAGKWNEKCTPAWRATAAVSGHKGGKFPAITVETTMPAEKRHEKCTPAWRTTAAVSGHTETNSSPSPSRRPCWRGNRMKNARRLGE